MLHFAAHGARTSIMSTRAVRNPRGKGLIRILLAAPETGTNGDTFDTLFLFFGVYTNLPRIVYFTTSENTKNPADFTPV